MQPTARLAILRVGTHKSVDGRSAAFSLAALSEIAQGYDPTTSEAPLVVGHPRLDDPAYGWAKSLSVEDGVLYAEPQQVEAQFAEMVNAGRFKNISACVYLPTTPGNPTPGKHYLKHIGFLGAAAPAVKGLRPAQFAEGDGALEFASPLGHVGSILGDLFRRMREHFIERDGVEAADKIIPAWQVSSLQEVADRDASASSLAFAAPSGNEPETAMSDKVELEALQSQLNMRATLLDERERVLAEGAAAGVRAEVLAFAEGLVAAGKLLPRQLDQVVEILVSLPAGAAVSFAEGDATVTKPTSDVLRQILIDMPVQVDFAEKSAGTVVSGPVSFAAPPSYSVDPGRLELHNKARAHMAQHPDIAYLDAVKAVGG